VRKTLPRRCFLRPALIAGAGLSVVCAPIVLPAQSPPSRTPQGVHTALAGTVLDRASDRPVTGALISLTRVGSAQPLSLVEADSIGEFTFPTVPVGHYTLTIQRFGYQDLTEDLLLRASVQTEITASLVPEAMNVEPVFVTVERRTSMMMADFERRRALGIGQFVTREDIEARRPREVSDLFRAVPGVRVVPDRRGDAHLVVRGRCAPDLYVDGVSAYEGMSLDLMLHPDDVEGIEVYTTASAPPQYARAACGVVIVWTRVPQRVQGRAGWWKPLTILGGLVGVLTLVR